MLNPQIKQTWVTALRSDEYQQHFGMLSNAPNSRELDKATAFCCIGVGVKVCQVSLSDELSATEAASLALGLSSSEAQELIRLNDEQRKSFAVIADHIEANL